jgi:uncharacterized membrane protein YdjX (TVP38/TMEM64 family)
MRLDGLAGNRAGRRAGLVLALAALVMVVAVLVAEAAGPDALNDPATWQSDATPAVAAASSGLLAADALLPVPSSVVMTLNGTVFGVAAGTLVSLLGATASAAIAFAVGTRFTGDVGRPFGPAMARHGAVVVAVTRPLPIAAELAAATAGATGMPLRRFLPAAACGATVTSFVYALAGRAVVDRDRAGLVVAAICAATAAAWFGGRAWTNAGGRT